MQWSRRCWQFERDPYLNTMVVQLVVLDWGRIQRKVITGLNSGQLIIGSAISIWCGSSGHGYGLIAAVEGIVVFVDVGSIFVRLNQGLYWR